MIQKAVRLVKYNVNNIISDFYSISICYNLKRISHKLVVKHNRWRIQINKVNYIFYFSSY